jgi:hypothetical protein
VKPPIKCEWDYLYGCLGVVGGETHFAHVPGVSLEWDASCLRDLAASDPDAVHVVMRDPAGFHLCDGDARLSAQVRIADLPSYSAQRNACEQLRDMAKDQTCNQVVGKVRALREQIGVTLRRYWEDAKAVLRLIGRDWLLRELNAARKSVLPV